MSVTLVDHGRDNERTFDDIAEAKSKKADLADMDGVDPDDLEIVQDNQSDDSPDETVNSPDIVEADTDQGPVDDLPDNQPIGEDPLQWIPDEFQDRIDGTIAINRKGFEVLAHHYDISCTTDMVERTDDLVIHKAIAITDDGVEYSAYGEAHASEDNQSQLVRISDTRAYKRAISRATGVGVIAIEELKNEL